MVCGHWMEVNIWKEAYLDRGDNQVNLLFGEIAKHCDHTKRMDPTQLAITTQEQVSQLHQPFIEEKD